MAATIVLTPPTIAHRDDGISVKLQTDLISTTRTRTEWQIAAPGPNVGQEIELKYANKSIAWLVTTTISQSGTNWPKKISTETIGQYLDRLLDLLRSNQALTDDFNISIANGDTLVLEYKLLTPLSLETITNLSHLTVTDLPVISPPQPDNLRALVDVYRADDNQLLLRQHAPYAVENSQALFDIAFAFEFLKPHLPNNTSIASSLVYLRFGVATSSFCEYYLRYYEKSGTPGIADAMQKTDTFFAITGGHAADVVDKKLDKLCHNYRRSALQSFQKPVSPNQPDWVYWIAPDILSVEVTVKLYWSDGTDSEHTPYAAGFTPELHHLYWIASGFKQLHLHLIQPPATSDPDAEVIGYDFRIGEMQAVGEYLAIVRYQVECCVVHEMFLLFDNGVGGCETVLLRGKKISASEYQRSSLQRYRAANWSPSQHEFDTFNATSKQTWEVSTGWYDDPFYLQHLRQLGLSKCWLVDTNQQRFLSVQADIKNWEWHTDDQDLFAVSFKLVSAWEDTNINI